MPAPFEEKLGQFGTVQEKQLTTTQDLLSKTQRTSIFVYTVPLPLVGSTFVCPTDPMMQ